MIAMTQQLTDPYATFLAALVTGFVGLILYAWKEWAQYRSVNKAILAEAQRLMEVIERHRDFWDERVKDKTTGHHPLIPLAHVVYDNQIANVGVVRGNKVAAVVRFYGYVDYLNQFQALRDVYDRSGNTDEFNRMYIGLLDRMLKSFRCTFGGNNQFAMEKSR